MVSQKPTDARSPGRAPALRRAADRYALRPLVRVQRIALFEREVRERLSRAALDVVFARAEVMSEGQRTSRGGAGRDGWFGSTMLTIDVGALGEILRDSCDAGTARRLAQQLASDPTVAARIKALAGTETARVAGARPTAINIEMKVEARGTRVFVDVDVEAVL